jgi:hypothetical protein
MGTKARWLPMLCCRVAGVSVRTDRFAAYDVALDEHALCAAGGGRSRKQCPDRCDLRFVLPRSCPQFDQISRKLHQLGSAFTASSSPN